MVVSWHLFFSFLGGALISGVLLWFSARKWILVNEKKIQEQLKFNEKEAQLIAKEAETRAKEEIEREKSLLEYRYEEWKLQLKRKEEELRNSINELNDERHALEDRSRELKRVESEIGRKRNNLENIRQLYRKRLVQLAHINEEEAKRLLKEEVIDECQDEVRIIRHEILGKSMEEIEVEAKRIIVDTVQRLASSPSSNLSAALIKLPNEDLKGRLIGKEGRNIKCFETITGATLLIDETPETVLVSSFDPVRREIAKIALESLIQDGRIHPATIEESVKKAEADINKQIKAYGEKAVTQLKVNGVKTEVLQTLGKLHFRLSNNQNTLEHSIEVAYLCSMIASELGLDPDIAKRCGLFHDMGKAISCENENSHALAAAQLLKRNDEDLRVVNAVASSHGEVPAESIYAEILKTADCLSATRPGARSESIDGYIQRIHNLEELALTFEGIEDCYAIQAGRELRVVVSPEAYEDTEARILASKIKRKIEDEFNYPGKIKVTVIREQRFVETAQ